MKSESILNKNVAKVLALSSALFITACSDNDNDSSPAPSPTVEFEVTLTNLTAGQPLSPAAVILHDAQWKSFSTGQAASVDLEYLAEGGDNSFLINSANEDEQVFLAESGAGIIVPGGHESFQLETSENNLGTLSLSVVSMLVNSNDAIVALNGEMLGSLELNESASFDLLTYDTGTEANSETADTIPGPAAEGGDREGFNSERDDVRDAVYVHAGVVTQDDGLATSTLSEQHRWDNPAVRVQVERIR